MQFKHHPFKSDILILSMEDIDKLLDNKTLTECAGMEVRLEQLEDKSVAYADFVELKRQLLIAKSDLTYWKMKATRSVEIKCTQ